MAHRDQHFLAQALELARKGRGAVEPNPQVGCVVVRDDGQVVGTGWHQQFGGPHAEVHAVQAAADLARGASVYVTLEPCCYTGKTPPCTEVLIDAGVARVIVGCLDPNPQVAGKGVARLRKAGIGVTVCDDGECHRLIAPFAKLMRERRPWVIAKWAMTLDGKLATRTGSSQWISNSTARALVHRLRGVVDGIIVGRGTVQLDDPQLTARPPGPRVATRIVLDTRATLSIHSRLVTGVKQAPILLVAGADAPQGRVQMLRDCGVEVYTVGGETRQARIGNLLNELGRRQMTNVLIEGGSAVLGSFFDAGAIDEVHAIIAPKLVGGLDAPVPIAGHGLADMHSATKLELLEVSDLDGDVYVHGFVTSRID